MSPHTVVLYVSVYQRQHLFSWATVCYNVSQYQGQQFYPNTRSSAMRRYIRHNTFFPHSLFYSLCHCIRNYSSIHTYCCLRYFSISETTFISSAKVFIHWQYLKKIFFPTHCWLPCVSIKVQTFLSQKFVACKVSVIRHSSFILTHHGIHSFIISGTRIYPHSLWLQTPTLSEKKY